MTCGAMEVQACLEGETSGGGVGEVDVARVHGQLVLCRDGPVEQPVAQFTSYVVQLWVTGQVEQLVRVGREVVELLVAIGVPDVLQVAGPDHLPPSDPRFLEPVP